MIERKKFHIPWMCSLAFQIPAVGLLLFFMLMGMTVFTLYSFSEPAMEKQANTLYIKTGERIAAEIQTRSNFAETLVRSLANVIEAGPKTSQFMLQIIPKILSVEDNMGDLIAGGGFWAAPSQFTPGVERRSFFWGENKSTPEKLDFYDHYNDVKYPSYHHEEWYVLAKYLPAGGVYWSKSYTDVHTGQRMVTVSTPVYREDRFFGVTTVDVRLESLNDLLVENAKAFEGRAFVLDHIGRVISLPDVGRLEKNAGASTDELLKTLPEYEFLNHQVKKVKQHRNEKIPFQIRAAVKRLATNIIQDTDQLSENEAFNLAARFYLQMNPKLRLLNDSAIESSSLLGERIDAHIFQLPVTNWHLITLAPQSFKEGSYSYVLESMLANQLAFILLLAVLTSVLTGYFLLTPLKRISDQLREASTDDSYQNLLKVRHKNEISALAYWYNQRTRQSSVLMRSLQTQISEKEEKEAELRRSRNRLRAIVDTASDRIWETDERGIYTFSSDSIKDVLGYEPEEVVGKSPCDFMPESEQQRIGDILRKPDFKHVPFSNQESIYIHKDGSHVICETSAVPIIDEAGEFFGYRGSDRDITLRKSTDRLQRDKKAAELANKSKSEFLASMSHELRTPLHGILSFANMGIKNPDRLTREKTAEYLGCIRTSGDRLLVLINDLLDLSKFEAGRMQLIFSNSSLVDITQSCIAEQQARLIEMSLSVSVKDNTVSSVGDFDAAKIAQTITNFLSNAIKFTSSNSVIEIEISDSQLNSGGTEAFLFSMRDYGDGIPKDDLEIIFERFSQSTKTSSDIIGTGLGLAICKEIIDRHQGRVWAENHPDGGALFQFIIPLERCLQKAVVA